MNRRTRHLTNDEIREIQRVVESGGIVYVDLDNQVLSSAGVLGDTGPHRVTRVEIETSRDPLYHGKIANAFIEARVPVVEGIYGGKPFQRRRISVHSSWARVPEGPLQISYPQ